MTTVEQTKRSMIQMLNEVQRGYYWLVEKKMALQRARTKCLHCLRQLDQLPQSQKHGERWDVGNVAVVHKMGHLSVESMMELASA